MQFGASGQLVPVPTGGAPAKDKLQRGGAWTLGWSLESWGRPCHSRLFWQATPSHTHTHTPFTWRTGFWRNEALLEGKAGLEGGSLSLSVIQGTGVRS